MAFQQRFCQFDYQLLKLIETQGNLDEIKSIIKNENMYNKDSGMYKNTLLHYAARYGNHKVVQYLIESGSGINSRNIFNVTPIMITIANMNCKKTENEKKYSDQMRVLKILVKAGAHIYSSKKWRNSALREIGLNDKLSKEILRLCLKKLQIDCMNDNKKIAKKLFAADWPIYRVIQLRDVGLTKVMLRNDKKAEIVNFVDHEDKTALHFAVENTDLKHVKLLLRYNANLNALDSFNRKPLSYVYGCDNRDHSDKKLKILKILLQRTYNSTRLTQHEDFRQVKNIFLYGNADAIELFFQNIDPNIVDRDSDYDQVPHMLAQNFNPGTIEQLKNRRFNINACVDLFYQTPLIIAASFGNANAVEFLLNEGANTDDVDWENCTALFNGIEPQTEPIEQRIECIQTLLERGANVQIETFYAPYISTVLDQVVRKKCFSLGELILAHLALEEVKGTTFTQLIQSKIDSNDRFKDFLESSKQLLNVQIYQSITLFDLLTATDKRLEGHVQNEDFVLKIEEFISGLTENYYFCHRLKKRFCKTKDMVKLKQDCAPVIGEIMNSSYHRFPHIVDEILDYLEKPDMRNLIDASLKYNS